MTNETYIDIEPVFIKMDKEVWVHPEVESLVGLKKPYWIGDEETAVMQSSKPVHRVYLENKSKTKIAYIVFVSKYLDENVSAMFEDVATKYSFKDAYGHDLVSALSVLLHEDIWSPGGTQFLETKMYNKIQKELGMDWDISFLSLDVILCKEDDRVWFES